MDRLEHIYHPFVSNWNANVFSPLLRLDLTWPSVTTVDNLLHPIREKLNLNPKEQILVFQISAYLGDLFLQTWSSLERYCALAEAIEDEIVISVRHALDAKDHVLFRINLTSTITSILASRSPVIAMAKDVSEISLGAGASLTLPFFTGVIFGMSPLGEGPWLTLDPSQHSEVIEMVSKRLAVQSARHFSVASPETHMGQVPEIYLNSTSTLLTQSNQSLSYAPYDWLIKFRDEYGVLNKDLAPISSQLSGFSDRKIAFGAFLTAAALGEGDYGFSAMAFGQSVDGARQLSRQYVSQLREVLGLSPAWDEDGCPLNDVAKSFLWERKCGLLPTVIFQPERICDGTICNIAGAIADGDTQDAQELIKKYLVHNPYDTDTVAQLLFLQIEEGHYELTDKVLTSFERLLTTSSYPQLLLEIKAILFASTFRETQALRCFEDLLSINTSVDYQLASIIPIYTSLLITKGYLTKAHNVLARIYGQYPWLFKISFHYIQTCLALDYRQEAASALENLSNLVPSDFRTCQLNFTFASRDLTAALK